MFVTSCKALPFNNITVSDAYNMIYSTDYPNLVVIDLRYPSDFDSGHLLGAINVPVMRAHAPPAPPVNWTILYDWIASPEGQSLKDHEIIVNCHGGKTSPNASAILDAAGFTHVNNMQGGITAWITAGYPTINITATIDVKPDTLNLKSDGKWVTCYIELPAPYNVSDINVTTVRLNGIIPAKLCPTKIGDFDRDGVKELMVKFDRKQVKSLLSVGEKRLWVTFALKDGKLCGGWDKIKVISCRPTPHWHNHWNAHWKAPMPAHLPSCRK